MAGGLIGAVCDTPSAVRPASGLCRVGDLNTTCPPPTTERERGWLTTSPPGEKGHRVAALAGVGTGPGEGGRWSFSERQLRPPAPARRRAARRRLARGRERLRQPAAELAGRLARAALSASEGALHAALGTARQPREEEGQDEEDGAHADDSRDEHDVRVPALVHSRNMSISQTLGRARRVEIPAGTVEVRERGSGPPVVFVHGVGVNGDLWRHVAPALAETHRVLVPDWPLGSHPVALRPGADLSVFGLADLVADVLEALELTDVTLVANDTGGAISQAVAARRREPLGALWLPSCDPFDNSPPPALRYLLPAAPVPGAMWLVGQSLRFKAVQRLPTAYGWTTHRPLPRAIMESYTRPVREDPGGRRDLTRLLRAVDPRHTVAAAEGLRGFDKPALVVWGADDRHFPREHGRRLAELLPQGRFEVVEGSRCFVPEDQPQRLVALLREFVRG